VQRQLTRPTTDQKYDELRRLKTPANKGKSPIPAVNREIGLIFKMRRINKSCQRGMAR
jgi:hypothetical protein